MKKENEKENEKSEPKFLPEYLEHADVDEKLRHLRTQEQHLAELNAGFARVISDIIMGKGQIVPCYRHDAERPGFMLIIVNGEVDEDHANIQIVAEFIRLGDTSQYSIVDLEGKVRGRLSADNVIK